MHMETRCDQKCQQVRGLSSILSPASNPMALLSMLQQVNATTATAAYCPPSLFTADTAKYRAATAGSYPLQDPSSTLARGAASIFSAHGVPLRPATASHALHMAHKQGAGPSGSGIATDSAVASSAPTTAAIAAGDGVPVQHGWTQYGVPKSRQSARFAEAAVPSSPGSPAPRAAQAPDALFFTVLKKDGSAGAQVRPVVPVWKPGSSHSARDRLARPSVRSSQHQRVPALSGTWSSAGPGHAAASLHGTASPARGSVREPADVESDDAPAAHAVVSRADELFQKYAAALGTSSSGLYGPLDRTGKRAGPGMSAPVPASVLGGLGASLSTTARLRRRPGTALGDSARGATALISALGRAGLSGAALGQVEAGSAEHLLVWDQVGSLDFADLRSPAAIAAAIQALARLPPDVHTLSARQAALGPGALNRLAVPLAGSAVTALDLSGARGLTRAQLALAAAELTSVRTLVLGSTAELWRGWSPPLPDMAAAAVLGLPLEDTPGVTGGDRALAAWAGSPTRLHSLAMPWNDTLTDDGLMSLLAPLASDQDPNALASDGLVRRAWVGELREHADATLAREAKAVWARLAGAAGSPGGSSARAMGAPEATLAALAQHALTVTDEWVGAVGAAEAALGVLRMRQPWRATLGKKVGAEETGLEEDVKADLEKMNAAVKSANRRPGQARAGARGKPAVEQPESDAESDDDDAEAYIDPDDFAPLDLVYWSINRTVFLGAQPGSHIAPAVPSSMPAPSAALLSAVWNDILSARIPRGGSLPLEHLDLSGCTGITDLSLYFIGAHAGSTLATLRLGGCAQPGLTDRGLWGLACAMGLPRLSELDLSGCSWLTSVGVRAVVYSAPALSWLRMAGCPGVDDMAAYAIASSPAAASIRAIDWTGTTTSALPLLRVADSCPSLSLMNITGCALITDTDAAMLAQATPTITLMRRADSTYRNPASLALQVPGYEPPEAEDSFARTYPAHMATYKLPKGAKKKSRAAGRG